MSSPPPTPPPACKRAGCPSDQWPRPDSSDLLVAKPGQLPSATAPGRPKPKRGQPRARVWPVDVSRAYDRRLFSAGLVVPCCPRGGEPGGRATSTPSAQRCQRPFGAPTHARHLQTSQEPCTLRTAARGPCVLPVMPYVAVANVCDSHRAARPPRCCGDRPACLPASPAHARQANQRPGKKTRLRLVTRDRVAGSSPRRRRRGLAARPRSPSLPFSAALPTSHGALLRPGLRPPCW